MVLLSGRSDPYEVCLDGLPLLVVLVVTYVGLSEKENFGLPGKIELDDLFEYCGVDRVADEVGFLRVALDVGLFGNEKRGLP